MDQMFCSTKTGTNVVDPYEVTRYVPKYLVDAYKGIVVF